MIHTVFQLPCSDDRYDRDRPQSVMEALIISLPFGLPTAIVVAPAKQFFVHLA